MGIFFPHSLCIPPSSGKSILLLLGSYSSSILNYFPDSRAKERIQVSHLCLNIDLCASFITYAYSLYIYALEESIYIYMNGFGSSPLPQLESEFRKGVVGSTWSLSSLHPSIPTHVLAHHMFIISSHQWMVTKR